ncbi:MAG TPA: GNAT family N-acetyltransferase [Tepidisphaeraceae bacterium]|jgi:ABC-type ATPase with predicted acetyltransferase domain
MNPELPDFLPGRLTLEAGTSRDYADLACYHYLPKRPATWAGVWVVRYTPNRVLSAMAPSRVVAVGVLSYPTPSLPGRLRYFQTHHLTRRDEILWANANVRTISRVIVHPQFRSLGLSTILVRHLCDHCPTRYIESAALMARAHPFFERAGMTRVEPKDPDDPVYFILDKESEAARAFRSLSHRVEESPWGQRVRVRASA